jgi:hypothetical protein
MVFNPTWSADSQLIYIITPVLDEQRAETVAVPADGSSSWSSVADRPGQITQDGKSLLIMTTSGFGPMLSASPDTTEVWLQALGDPDSRRLVLGGAGAVYPSSFSPGGRYLLYYEQRGGFGQPYLTRYPEFTGRWQVSMGEDVTTETFAPDGSAIYYTTDRELFRVAFEETDPPSLGRPERVAELPEAADGAIEVRPDGDSYVVAIREDSGSSDVDLRGIKIVQNWTRKLDRR